jgi:hypothetical protein
MRQWQKTPDRRARGGRESGLVRSAPEDQGVGIWQEEAMAAGR